MLFLSCASIRNLCTSLTESLAVCSIQKNTTVTTTHEPLHARNDETSGSIEFLQPYPVVAADALFEIGTAVISAILSLDEHLSHTNTSCVPKFRYQSVYCCLIRYFNVRIRIAKCFTSSSKRFRCEVMFENEHTFHSWIRHVCTCTTFAQLAWAAA
jgi:hypothetical protein